MSAKTKKSKTAEPASLEIKRLFVDAVNKYADSRKRPRVGIFWYHNKKVLGDFFELTAADIYGNILGPHSNHYDYWHEIQRACSDFADEEYEYIPRGRVLYDLTTAEFVIISSASIVASKSAIKAIRRHCNIPDKAPVVLKTDQHYENPIELDWDDE
ncbi:MAG: hypothetical protein PHF08_06890 [Candidatus Riflebacteria bacterium]|nr:hypothetical protein [Candidatus Riflebacteria bacterium]